MQRKSMINFYNNYLFEMFKYEQLEKNMIIVQNLNKIKQKKKKGLKNFRRSKSNQREIIQKQMKQKKNTQLASQFVNKNQLNQLNSLIKRGKIKINLNPIQNITIYQAIKLKQLLTQQKKYYSSNKQQYKPKKTVQRKNYIEEIFQDFNKVKYEFIDHKGVYQSMKNDMEQIYDLRSLIKNTKREMEQSNLMKIKFKNMKNLLQLQRVKHQFNQNNYFQKQIQQFNINIQQDLKSINQYQKKKKSNKKVKLKTSQVIFNDLDSISEQFNQQILIKTNYKSMQKCQNKLQQLIQKRKPNNIKLFKDSQKNRRIFF